MEINKGPDWTAAQFTAGAIGFFASAAVAHLLVSQGYATGNWPVILIAIGLCGSTGNRPMVRRQETSEKQVALRYRPGCPRHRSLGADVRIA
jgi:hypothetical protein